LPEPTLFTEALGIHRLPPHLKQLLSGFCFASNADLANAVGMMLTGMLMSHHTETLHPLGLLDGNQPGVGKTMLARTLGMLLDGKDPQLINYTPNDEELSKRLLATLRDGNPSVVVIDNAKVRAGSVVSSSVLEANSVAPEIALRILGVSRNYVRPNTVLWFLTMNDTKVSPDLVSRCVPIRFRHEGDPGQRAFVVNPVEYARTYRSQILGELAGMVLRWIQEGSKLADRAHRLRRWAEQIGGILEANGLPEFLTNLQQAANEFNTELDDLGALAEQCLKSGRCWFQKASGSDNTELVLTKGAKPSRWRELLKNASLMEEELQAARGDRSAGLKITNFLSKYINREVAIRHQEQELTATLRVAEGRSREKFYCFEISGEMVEGPADPSNNEDQLVAQTKACATQLKRPKRSSGITAALSPEPLDVRKDSTPSLACRKQEAPTTASITAIGAGGLATGNSESWA
jgi:hypothetical protein